ncbi:hypothetical protein BVZ80_00602B, partial [Haemophilus influenzae]
IRL